MLDPPTDLSIERIAATVGLWGFSPAEIEYAPWGFGSHHWIATDAAGERRFVTVDTTEAVSRASADPFGGLRTAMKTARSLADHGLEFVVPPLPSLEGSVVVEISGRYAATVFAFVPGRRFGWEDRLPPDLERQLVSHLARLHQTGTDVGVTPRADDFGLPHREALDSLVFDGRRPAEAGPYTKAMTELITANAPSLVSALRRYDETAARARASAVSPVITHGEPHQGNTIDTPAGLRLVDWDTTLLAPRERDLWMLASHDIDLVPAYEEATGARVNQVALDLYRTLWDLADLAAFVAQFAGAHRGDANDEASWRLIQHLVDRLVAGAGSGVGPGETSGSAT